MIDRLTKAASVYRRSYRSVYAYLKRTGDYRLLWEDLLWVIAGEGRPRWLP